MFYSVQLEHSTESTGCRSVFLPRVEKTDLHKMIGRYCLKYNMPYEENETDPVRVLEFYKKTEFGYISATISFWEAEAQDKSEITKSSSYPERKESTYKPPVYEKEDGRIEALLEANLLSRSYL